MKHALKRSVDYLVIGGGSGGCVMANRLSGFESAPSVCLLEHGPVDSSPLIHTPIGFSVMMMGLAGRQYQYYNLFSEPEKHLFNRKTLQPRGRTLGGSSSLNAMIYIRGHSSDYDKWSESIGQKNEWSYKHVLEEFKQFESNQDLKDTTYHGLSGELKVTSTRFVCDSSKLFLEACKTKGYPILNDFNGQQFEGCGLYQRTIIDGERCSSAKAFLTDSVKARANLSILTNKKVVKIHIEGTTARAVTCVDRITGEMTTINVDKEVILCAGAFGSPQVLQLSGIGDPEDLKEFNIPVVHSLKGVGKNLQDHLNITVEVQSKKGDLPNIHHSQAFGFLREAARYLNKSTKQDSYLASNIADAGGFINTSKGEDDIPDVQLHFLPTAFRDHGRKVQYGVGMSLKSCLLRPFSKGKVSLKSADPLEVPRIQMNYLDDPRDLVSMIRAVKAAKEIFTTNPLSENVKKFVNEEIGDVKVSDAAWEKYVRQHAETIYHPVGTCKMGSGDDAVVDHELKLKGINNIRIADASIMPTLISGNTNAPTMMIANKCAKFILRDSK